MPWSPEKKQQSRKRILDAAIELFFSRGYEQVSIGEVMERAGMTHGAFYSHFESKSQLYREALLAGAGRSGAARLTALDRDNWQLQELVDGYLDQAHIRMEQSPCPLAFLTTDIASRDGRVRNAYTRVYQRMLALMGRRMKPARDRRQRLLAASALMIGGVAVGRALDDPELVEELLTACRREAGALVGK